MEQRKHVVVIGEDDEPIACLLGDAINDEPAYQAVIVPDGALVVETVRQVHADMLILDVMMPGLFVTAGSQEDERQFKDREIADVIAKPFDLNELLAKVRALCPP